MAAAAEDEFRKAYTVGGCRWLFGGVVDEGGVVDVGGVVPFPSINFDCS